MCVLYYSLACHHSMVCHITIWYLILTLLFWLAVFVVLFCEYFLKFMSVWPVTNSIIQIDCLESMVEITKNLPVSRSTILKYLLEGYGKCFLCLMSRPIWWGSYLRWRYNVCGFGIRCFLFTMSGSIPPPHSKTCGKFCLWYTVLKFPVP